MKLHYSRYLLVFLFFLFINSCNKNDEPKNLVLEYSNQVGNLHDALEDFIQKTQTYETTNFTTQTVAQTKKIVNDYLASGQTFVDVLNKIEQTQQNSKSARLKSASELPCGPVDLIPGDNSGLSPGLAKAVGDLISETKGEVAAIQKKYDNKEIDDETYNAALNQLKMQKTTKAVNVGLGAVVGTGASLGAGLIIGAATLPAIATVTAVGVVVGTSVTWFANWYSGVKSTNGTTQHYIVSGKTTVGGKLPVHLLENGANVTISINGYAPVVLSNFLLPQAGHNKTINITPVKLSDAQAGTQAEVCMLDEVMAASSCSDVEFVNGSPSPQDPAPGQGVTVTATLIPAVQGCSISFSIVGTDGYSDSATKTSNSAGQATFYIPGGAEGVFDMVTITTDGGISSEVSYTF